ncbi:class I SAM-dependent methyltransferase [Solirubrobacter phytolaccae]|uniref:Class I SAM-dependent methyltransferase n=1 Tax=Solirubrobacter phytolaccae TaxID=1404360 RepID=A0A9X3NLJ2_9ACTN|nr:class I SAM-dependent methyltransferase [Solirubrobacter phytolaccae]MDA0185801.1 class I SAM-dependent methyltransferase [Solirubrobacter phytolaccae]
MTDYFAGEIAERYDETSAAMFAPDAVDPVVDVLAALAGGGRALEFAIGTGRIALPLAARGVEVAGIELSADMVEQLRAKEGGATLDVTLGSFSDTRVDGSFALVYLVFNTIGNVTTQAEQVATFRNAAAHLAPGGHFVIEVGVPELRRLPPGQNTLVFEAREGKWGIDEYDFVDQGLVSHHFEEREDGHVERTSMPFRYAFPAEYDLMAELAGLALHARWADWHRSPFTGESTKHISIWQKP